MSKPDLASELRNLAARVEALEASPTIYRAGLVKAVETKRERFISLEAYAEDMASRATENMAEWETKAQIADAKSDLCDWFLALLNAPSSQKETRP
jgi:hypothetical protein